MQHNAEITYAIDKNYWNKGLNTKVVLMFLVKKQARLMYDRVAFDNFGSQRILEKVGL